MSQTDVITVAQAKRWLELDDEEDTELDAEITGLIKTAIDWVENYTSYRLYQRNEVIPNSRCDQTVALYPITVSSVKNQNGDAVDFKTYTMPTKLRIRCPYDSVITLQVGYSNPAVIPQPLIDAAKKMIVYLYENRDIYEWQLPNDMQMLLNQYRRAFI